MDVISNNGNNHLQLAQGTRKERTAKWGGNRSILDDEAGDKNVCKTPKNDQQLMVVFPYRYYAFLPSNWPIDGEPNSISIKNKLLIPYFLFLCTAQGTYPISKGSVLVNIQAEIRSRDLALWGKIKRDP